MSIFNNNPEKYLNVIALQIYAKFFYQTNSPNKTVGHVITTGCVIF